MSLTLKQELIEKILATDDENLLQILKADYDYFVENDKPDVLDELTETDKAELTDLLKEPFGKDTELYEDFQKATERWRIK